ncbi:MAG TPA: lysylphosphatidylglycerol synthase transmembrane domain-containing protein [Candidatus Bathyarchaeia archaeon]|nr:lysylphosphatidylglycerol synthase transmembrane domain-containing protein [Candidatus Bathyarchaeia archaeon]
MFKAKTRKVLGRAAAYLAAAVGLAWVVRDIRWPEFLKSVSGIDWRWVVLGLLADIASYAIQGVRWRLLLKPLGDISALKATQAVYAGLFLNEIAPFHLGEIARAYPVSRWLSTSLVAVVPSMALERLFDGIWLAAGLGLTAIFVPLPRDLLEAGDIFGLSIIALSGGLMYLLIRKAREPRSRRPGRPRPAVFRWIGENLRKIESGLRTIGLTRTSAAAFLISFLYVVLQAGSFWFIMIAYGLKLSFWIGGAVFLIVRFGSVIPGAPGNVGLYQVFTVLGLTLFGVDRAVAAGFSIVVFVLLSAPLWGIGALALGGTGLTLASLKAKLKERRSHP